MTRKESTYGFYNLKKQEKKHIHCFPAENFDPWDMHNDEVSGILSPPPPPLFGNT